MKSQVFGLMLFVLPLILSAQNKSIPQPGDIQGCPVSIDAVWPSSHLPIVAAEPDPWDLWLSMRYRNVSGKIIEAIQFGVSYSDILTPDVADFHFYLDERKFKPTKRQSGAWSNGVYTHVFSKKISARVRLMKVVFEDSSVWERGDNSCEWVYTTN